MQVFGSKEAKARWLITSYNQACNLTVLGLDNNLKQVEIVEKDYQPNTDVYFTRDNNGQLYVVALNNSDIVIENLADLHRKAAWPDNRSKASSPLFTEILAHTYHNYITSDGKRLLKATSEDLATDIQKGNEESALISYYRLLARDKKLAKRSISKRVVKTVKESIGQELWLIDMELSFFGEPAVEPLFQLVADGQPEERSIAIEVLYTMGDQEVSERLVNLLDEPFLKDNLDMWLAICKRGLEMHNAKAVSSLIETATDVNSVSRHPGYKVLLKKSREQLRLVSAKFEDRPKDWSKKAWLEWWKKYPNAISGSGPAYESYRQRWKVITRQHKVFKHLAKMLNTQASR
jgi:hypothetical protein